jgi:hypothetical protein
MNNSENAVAKSLQAFRNLGYRVGKNENNWYPEITNENLKKYQNEAITEDIIRIFGSELPSIRKITNSHRDEYRRFLNYTSQGYYDNLSHAYRFFMPYLIEEFLNAETPEQAIQILREHPQILSEQLESPYGEYSVIESQTPLMYAIRNNKLELFNYIIDQPSIDVNALEYGLAPIHVITFENNVEMLRLLLRKSTVDVNIQNSEDKTALHLASSSELIQELLSASDIDPNSQDGYGNTPLHEAVNKQNETKLKLLLADTRVQTDILNNEHNAPETVAAIYGYRNIYQLFQQREKLMRQAAWNRRKHAVMGMHTVRFNRNNERKQTQRRRKNRRHTLRRRK